MWALWLGNKMYSILFFSISTTIWPKKNQDKSFNFEFIARVFDDHWSCQKLINYITNIKAISKRYYWIQKLPVWSTIERLLANLGRILLFHYFFFYIKTGIQDFLLDIYSTYKSFVWTVAIELEVSGSNNIVHIKLNVCYFNDENLSRFILDSPN
jgi:hypothetical protein